MTLSFILRQCKRLARLQQKQIIRFHIRISESPACKKVCWQHTLHFLSLATTAVWLLRTMSKAIVSSITACHILLLAAIVMLQSEGVKSLNIGGFNINFGGPKVTLPQASKEFLSLQGVQVQSVSTGALVDCEQLLKSKSKGSTLFVVNTTSSPIEKNNIRDPIKLDAP